MARRAILRGPDLDSARRDPNTGGYMDKAHREMVSKPRGMRGSMKIRSSLSGPRRRKL